MYELNKQKFGAFVSALRKERGYTQKELAQKLFISDKAVSKWETGMSVPDVSLLVPLSELLGVSVTELLMCEKMEQPAQMDTCQVENLVKTAIAYADETPQRAYQSDRKKAWLYAVSLAVGILWMFLHWKNGSLTEAVRLCAGFGAGFGLYFFFFVRTKLPSFYDENSISGFYDGPVRMNLAGVRFNNRNWPHIVHAGRLWCCAAMAVLPAVPFLGAAILPDIWPMIERYVLLVLLLGGLFIPMYAVGIKYK